MAAILTEHSVQGDLLIFEDLINHAYHNVKKMDPMTLLREMVSHGVIQIDALFEQAISTIGSLPRESVQGRDFVDGSDAKKALTQWLIEPGHSTRRVARIGKIAGKHGPLRIIVGETLTGKTYYFKVPRKIYQGLRVICIYFNADGTPKNGKWFRYQVSTFEELCS